MLMFELILTKHPSEWSDADWELVRDAIKEGKVTVERLKQIDFAPIIPKETGINPRFAYHRSCMVEEFFKTNPTVTVASIYCSCPKCVISCVA